MRHPTNIQSLVALNPTFMGIIFYKNSKRYVGDNFDPAITQLIPSHIYKVGVFVDEDIETIIDTVSKYKLQYVQLHGSESVDYCKDLKCKNINLIKAISITPNFNFDTILKYQTHITYFLFDTATPQKGGSGQVFDWSILNNYTGTTPFLLAGGINEHNFQKASNLKHPQLFGLDLNSGFETSPGLKNIELLKKTIALPANS